MTNYPPGGDIPPHLQQDPGAGYGQPQDEGYGQAQTQYPMAPQAQGYAAPLAQYDAGGQQYPVQVSVEYPEQSSRLLAGLSIPLFLARYIMLIPAFIVLEFVAIAAVIAVWLAFWAVLFTGRYPPSFHEFVTGYLRWSTRVSAYMFGLTDKYPPFRLRP